MTMPSPIEAQPGDDARLAFQMCETGESVSFGDLDTRANQVAHVLRACGVARGSHVALLMKNHRRLLEACFGADRAGVYYTTIGTLLLADEVACIVRDCGARVLLVSEGLDDLVQRLGPLHEGLRCFMAGAVAEGFEPWDPQVDNAPGVPVADAAQYKQLVRRRYWPP